MAASCRLALLFLASLAATAAAPVEAGLVYHDETVFSHAETFPRVAVDTVPVRFLYGFASWFATSAPPPIVRRDGDTFEIYLTYRTTPGCGWPDLVCYQPPPPGRPQQADFGVLESGVYQVELYVGSPVELGGQAGLAASDRTSFTVVAGPVLRILPGPPGAGAPAALEVEFPPGICPRAEPAEVFGRKILVAVSLGDCGSVETISPLPPLEPGTYQAELTIDGQVYATQEVEALPEKPRLGGGRFEVDAAWRTAAGAAGVARLVQKPSADSALFYFFSETNWELMVKVLDSCAINGHFWVFSAASTDVGFAVAIEDLATGRGFSFANAAGTPAGAINAVDAFPCP